jgi:hypothetical protein
MERGFERTSRTAFQLASHIGPRLTVVVTSFDSSDATALSGVGSGCLHPTLSRLQLRASLVTHPPKYGHVCSGHHLGLNMLL